MTTEFLTPDQCEICKEYPGVRHKQVKGDLIYRVECGHCEDVQGPYSPTIASAVRGWNRGDRV